MMPWWHLAASLIISYILVASLGLDIVTGVSWIIVGSFFGTFIDSDHILYAVLVHRRDAKKIIKKSILDPKGLIDDFREKRSLNFNSAVRMVLHAITMSTVYVISLYLFPSYSLVIGIAFITHLMLDIDTRWFKY